MGRHGPEKYLGLTREREVSTPQVIYQCNITLRDGTMHNLPALEPGGAKIDIDMRRMAM